MDKAGLVTLAPFSLPCPPDCRVCSVSLCGAREQREPARSQTLIQRDQGADTQKNPTAPQKGAMHFAPACPNLWGSNLVRASTSLVNLLSSWSFSSSVSSFRHQKAFRTLNTRPQLTVAQELPSGKGEGKVAV